MTTNKLYTFMSHPHTLLSPERSCVCLHFTVLCRIRVINFGIPLICVWVFARCVFFFKLESALSLWNTLSIPYYYCISILLVRARVWTWRKSVCVCVCVRARARACWFSNFVLSCPIICVCGNMISLLGQASEGRELPLTLTPEATRLQHCSY